MVLTLLLNKLIIGMNTLRRGDRASKVRALATGVMFVVVFGSVYMASQVAFEAMLTQGATPFPRTIDPSFSFGILQAIPPVLFSASFILLIISAITIGLQLLYLSPELGLLMASPVRYRDVFLAKFVEALGANSGLFLVLGMPILLAYAQIEGMLGIGFLGVLGLIFLAFSAITTSIGLVICIGIARFVSPARAKPMLVALGTVSVAGYWLASNLMAFSAAHPLSPEENFVVPGYFRSATLTLPPWGWAGNVITSLVIHSDTVAAARDLAFLIGTAAVCVFGVGTLAQHAWFHGWSSGQEMTAGGRRRRALSGTVPRDGIFRLLPAPIRAVGVKETRIFFRDIRQLSLLLIPLGAVAVMAFGARVEDGARLPQWLAQGTMLPMAILLIAALSFRVALAAFTSENKAFWLLMSSPIAMRAALIGKTIYAFVLSISLALLALGLFYGISGLRLPMLELTLPLLLMATAALCGIGIGMSALFVDLNRDSPREAVSIGGRLLCLLMDILYLGMAATIGALGWIGAVAIGLSTVGCILVTCVSVGVLSLLFTIFPVLLGAERLGRLEWS